VRWHRAGFRRYWRWKSRRRGGRPPVETELRALIRRMSIENPLWGAPRIHGELLTLAALNDPVQVIPMQPITISGTVHGHPAGVARDLEDTLNFAALQGIRPMVEVLPQCDDMKGDGARGWGPGSRSRASWARSRASMARR